MKIMFNEDWNHFYVTRHKMGIEVNEDVLKEFIYQYKDTQITDFSLNVNARLSSFPSSVLESFVDKYYQKVENGEEVDYTDSSATIAYKLFVEQNIDMYQVFIDTLREIDITPWVSVRLNDCHGSFSETDLLLPEFFHKNKHLRRVTHREANGYYDRCYDFSHPEIRNMMLDYIREVLERYDMDGMELDCTRELLCFKPGFETQGLAIINQLMRDIKTLLTEAEKKRGHKIKFCVLVNAEPNMNLNAGFDIVQWAKEHLIDIVVALPRWTTMDTDIPVPLWKRLLEPYNVKFAAGHQSLLSPREGYKTVPSSLDTVIGNAAAFLGLGADFTYIYNFMDHTDMLYPNSDFEQCYLKANNLKTIFSTIGDKQLVDNSRRRHVLTFKDHPNYWEKINYRLPIVCSPDDFFESIRIAVGDIPESSKVSLIMGIASDKPVEKDDIEVYVNSSPAPMVSTCDIVTNVCDDPGYKFAINNPGDIQKYAVIEFKSTSGDFTVNYVEILVDPDISNW